MPADILLLQGPVGPFFSRFARDLERAGHRVFKINFNGGDKLYSGSTTSFDFTGRPEQWPAYLVEKIDHLGIGIIYLFGDCRYYHAEARRIARERRIKVFVFEEGYLRPNFITLEENGVNGHSGMVRLADHYRRTDRPEKPEHSLTGNSFTAAAFHAVCYYLAGAALSKRFPHYRHHREFRWLPEGLRWLRGGWRKIRYGISERSIRKTLLGKSSPRFFLVALQVHSDMQIRAHSGYTSIEQFIIECLESFAMNAPSGTKLVIKHHPMDRGYTDYSDFIRNQAARFGLSDRVVYLHDINLPALLKKSSGLVTVNSTVGLSALHHRKPVKVLGKAIYDIPGLTSQQPLDAFWKKPQPVDHDLYQRFRAWLLRNNQIKGNFYRRLAAVDNRTGTIFPTKLAQQVFRQTTPPASHAEEARQTTAETHAMTGTDGPARSAGQPAFLTAESQRPAQQLR